MAKIEIRIDPNYSGKCTSGDVYFAENKFEFVKIIENFRMQIDSGNDREYVIFVKDENCIPIYIYKITEYLPKKYEKIIEIKDYRLSRLGFDRIIDLISFENDKICILKKIKTMFPGKLSKEQTIDIVLSDLYGLTLNPTISEAVKFLIMWHHGGLKERLDTFKEEISNRLKKAIDNDLNKLLSSPQSLNAFLMKIDESILSQLIDSNCELVHSIILKRFLSNRLEISRIGRNIIQTDIILAMVAELQALSNQRSELKELSDFIKLHFRISQLEKKIYLLPEYIRTQHQKELIKRLKELKKNFNKIFAEFIEQNYRKWVQSKPRPVMSMDILEKILEKLKNGNRILLIVFDGMSILEWLILEEELSKRKLKINRDVCLSLIPSVTVYSRNAIFSGLSPDVMSKKFYSNGPVTDNRKEGDAFKSYFISLGFNAEFRNVGNIWREEEKIFDLMSKKYDVIGVVVRHIDAIIDAAGKGRFDRKFLAKSFSSYVKDIANFIKESVERGYVVAITADHGNTEIDESIIVKIKNIIEKDYFAHSRYFVAGRRLKDDIEMSIGKKSFIFIRDPTNWRLPQVYKNKLIYVAVDPFKFTLRKEEGVISHGGATMDELIVPFVEVYK